MADKIVISEARAQATARQAYASDPGHSRWVSANAGSGKTHVLVGRVSRLLLANVDPDNILCLTYTKAAAAEMQARLFSTLGTWSVMDDATLSAKLRELVGDKASLSDLARARGLFAKALETPEGLKVQTIHAFCANVLGRFPIEAGILPGFDQIDDSAQTLIAERVKQQMLEEAWEQPEGELSQHLTALARDHADQTLDTLFGWMAGHTQYLLERNLDADMASIATILDVDPKADSETLRRAAWESLDQQELKAHIVELRATRGTTELKTAEALERALEMSQRDPAEAWQIYSMIFLTTKLALKATGGVTQKSSDHLAHIYGRKGVETTPAAQQVFDVLQQCRAADLLAHARDIHGLAHHYARIYRDIKRARRVIDFNDQIHLIHDLLNRTEAADWVRYKLDGGISHILIDEAQDTSDMQWAIIDALRESFDLPDERTGTEAKTVFAVGDEKQSIFGFQGARPATFIRRINGANPDNIVRMGTSFRSAPEILEAVDSVFVTHGAGARMFSEQIEGAASDARHFADRSDVGAVELWPPVPFPEEGEAEIAWDPRPVDGHAKAHPKEELARTLAQKIRDWIADKRPIYDRDLKRTRPLEAGDIFILVKSRDAFFDAMIRNLKLANVPVAGADRLKLGEAVIVKDLMAMARWALYPKDNLSLAELLKSPLLGYDEDALYRVAQGRGKLTLWESVAGSSHPQDQRATELLTHIIDSVRSCPPYEFFTSALDARREGQTLRFHVERRLGLESRDPLMEFLGQALAFQRRHSASLQHFVAEWDGRTIELKREVDARGSEVRIMTVHGSKGLQAPLVILPQTTSAPSKGSKGDMLSVPTEAGDNVFIPRPKTDETPPGLEAAVAAADLADAQEHLRLLYVAMTRAESRLIICGYGKKKPSKNKDPKDIAVLRHEKSWHAEVTQGLAHLETTELNTPFGEGALYGADPKLSADTAKASVSPDADLPDWIAESVPHERADPRRVTPSHILSSVSAGPVRSPLSRTAQVERDRRFLRGNLIHKLLEVLPDIETDVRRAVADAILEKHRLAPELTARIIEEVFTVMERHPEIFAPGSRAEVSLAGQGGRLPKGLRLNAQIDRLAVTPERVYIIDYKSNRPPPKAQADVSAQYLGQMAAYRELAREIYDRPVTCALLWTDNADFMELEDARLDAALETIRDRLARDLTST
jgi:ATP-dependent helicase/nuclease subunit A